MLDCEGYEAKLLDPTLVPKLRACDLIVELHDQAPTPEHPLVRRFRETHDMELIPAAPRTLDDAPHLEDFSAAEQLQLMDEMRHAWQGWAIFRHR
jgi:HrpA-like RNA helicase